MEQKILIRNFRTHNCIEGPTSHMSTYFAWQEIRSVRNGTDDIRDWGFDNRRSYFGERRLLKMKGRKRKKVGTVTR